MRIPAPIGIDGQQGEGDTHDGTAHVECRTKDSSSLFYILGLLLGLSGGVGKQRCSLLAGVDNISHGFKVVEMDVNG